MKKIVLHYLRMHKKIEKSKISYLLKKAEDSIEISNFIWFNWKYIVTLKM